MQDITPQSPCPCTSGEPYENCCKPWHDGEPAPAPEALMRSRFAAFRLELGAYLLSTWDSETRPASLSFEGNPNWQSLQINDHSQSGDAGYVDFTAIYRTAEGWGYLAELSRFKRTDGRWFYCEGDTREGTLKPGRNDRCLCGSGRKFKSCCQG